MFDFPTSPTIGQVSGNYTWNGYAWMPQSSAAPLDALAYSGMQINGSFDVSQELGAVGTATGPYFCDGWKGAKSGPMVCLGTATPVVGYIPGFPIVGLYQATTPQASLGAAEYAVMQQPIEGYRVARLSWGYASAKPITVAFWSGHTPAGVYSLTVRNSAATRSYGTTYTQAVAAVPQYNVITIPGCTDGVWEITNMPGLVFTLAMASGTTYTAPSANSWLSGSVYLAAPGQINGVVTLNNIMRVTGYLVLPGIYAPTAAQSALIMRPYGEELVTCKRYWERTNFYFGGTASFAGAVASIIVPISAEKRVNPTITQFAQGASNFTWSGWLGGVRSAGVTGTTPAAGQYVMDYAVNVDARL